MPKSKSKPTKFNKNNLETSHRALIITLIIMGFSTALILTWQTTYTLQLNEPTYQETIDNNPSLIEDTASDPRIEEANNNLYTDTKNSRSDKGATLETIKYTLPDGWLAQIQNNSLHLASSEGGYIFVTVETYDGVSGRRETYCNLTKLCIPGTTYFTETRIGNISGYVAQAIDNSGGGPDYFGVKGDKFYIISTYTPPNVDEQGNLKVNAFARDFDKVMASFQF